MFCGAYDENIVNRYPWYLYIVGTKQDAMWSTTFFCSCVCASEFRKILALRWFSLRNGSFGRGITEHVAVSVTVLVFVDCHK